MRITSDRSLFRQFCDAYVNDMIKKFQKMFSQYFDWSAIICALSEPFESMMVWIAYFIAVDVKQRRLVQFIGNKMNFNCFHRISFSLSVCINLSTKSDHASVSMSITRSVSKYQIFCFYDKFFPSRYCMVIVCDEQEKQSDEKNSIQ